MALIECYECKNQISSHAACCPSCGAPVELDSGAGTPLATTQLTSKKFKVHEIYSAILTILGIILLIFFAANGSFILLYLGVFITLIGLIWFICTKFRIWWHHG